MDNAARSQMAEAFLRRLAPDRCEAFSAGSVPTRVDPLAARAMAEVGIDIGGQRAKALEPLLTAGRFDYVVTLCDEAVAECPYTHAVASECTGRSLTLRRRAATRTTGWTPSVRPVTTSRLGSGPGLRGGSRRDIDEATLSWAP